MGVQSRVRHAEREWRRNSRARRRRQRFAATTAKTVWWSGNRYDVLGEDGHALPAGGRILLRELESRPRGPRIMPYIRLGRYRGDVVEDHGGTTGPLFRVSNLTTREGAGGWAQVTPELRALRYPYSVLSYDRIGRWRRECAMLGPGQDVRARVSDPKKRVQTDLVVPQHGPEQAMPPQTEIHRGHTQARTTAWTWKGHVTPDGGPSGPRLSKGVPVVSQHGPEKAMPPPNQVPRAGPDGDPSGQRASGLGRI